MSVYSNWHRWYEPGTGRYWQSEMLPGTMTPRAGTPRVGLSMVASGDRFDFDLQPGLVEGLRSNQQNQYAYALQSPLAHVDPTGLNPACRTTYDCCVERAIEMGLDPKQQCGHGPEDIPNPDWDKCQRMRIECKNACNAGCEDPTSRLHQARLLMCYAVCDIALAACMAKAPLRN